MNIQNDSETLCESCFQVSTCSKDMRFKCLASHYASQLEAVRYERDIAKKECSVLREAMAAKT